MINRRKFLAGNAVLLGTSMAGCLARGFSGNADVSEMIDRSFAAPSVDAVEITNRIGDVYITALGSGDVRAEVLKRSRRGPDRLEAIDVSIGVEGGTLSVTADIADSRSWYSKDAAWADIRVVVPAGLHSPEISSVRTEIGTISLSQTHGDTAARTRIGDITASGVDGYLNLKTDIGNILASDVTGLDRVQTEIGDVKVELLSLRRDVSIGNETGPIVVGVADHLDLDLSVETDATIDSNLRLTDHKLLPGRLTGRQNNGGHRVRVTSHLGAVSLRAIPSDT